MSSSLSRQQLAVDTPTGGKIAFQVFPDLKLTISTWVGSIDGPGMVAAYRVLYQHPAWSPNNDELADLRDADTRALTTEALRQLAALEDQTADKMRSAVLTNGGLNFGLARMYGALAEAGARLEVFTDESKALEWLGAPKDLRKNPPQATTVTL